MRENQRRSGMGMGSLIGLVASVVTLFIFLTNITSLGELLRLVGGTITPTPEVVISTVTSQVTLSPPSTPVPTGTESVLNPATLTPIPTETKSALSATTSVAPLRWYDNYLNGYYVKIDEGSFEFGSSEFEVNNALELCYEYSEDLCDIEAFIDELVAESGRGRSALPDYWIMETEVTNAQYDSCILAGGCRQLDASTRSAGLPDQPVRIPDVNYAIEFASWACGRLPTELEWEKAARGPDGLVYPWGDHWDAQRVNSCGAECSKKPLTDIVLLNDGFEETSSVTSFESGRSPYGLYNMAGNVREWAVRDKNRPFSRSYDYMLKGGSFFDFPEVLRSADRLRWPTDNRYPDIITAGFRIVRDTTNECS